MRRSIRTSYTHTILASYLGYITQAVVNNFAPLLFLTFRSQMGLTLEQITLLTTLNFSIQLLVDFLSVKVVDRIGRIDGQQVVHMVFNFPRNRLQRLVARFQAGSRQRKRRFARAPRHALNRVRHGILPFQSE